MAKPSIMPSLRGFTAVRPQLRRLAALVAVSAVFVLAGMPAQAQVVPPVEQRIRDDISVVTLATGLRDVTNIDVAPDGRVVMVERTGRVKIWHQDGTTVEAGRIGVDSSAGQCGDCEGQTLDEGGLHGVLLARDFLKTGHVYLYYSVPNSLDSPPIPAKHPKARGPQNTEGKFRLSRFTITEQEVLDLSSEVPVLENPAEWFRCCHYGGDMEWLADGTIVLSTGDDTISSQSGGYGPRDYRPGQEFNNADLTSQNPADRRGKILRLMPDGSVPDGSQPGIAANPFVGDAKYDPYVYAMGFRSPYRIAVDPTSQNVIVGNVGPDGRWPDPTRGPAAHEEIEIVPAGGGTNHGWPRCIANNQPYNDYNWATGTAGGPLSCAGMTPAAFTYSYTPYPTTNTNVMIPAGVGSAVQAGVVYRDGNDGALALPERFEDQLLWFEWSRGGAWMLPVDGAGAIVNDSPLSLTPVLDGLSTPIDMAIGPDGAVYLAEYGGSLYNGANSKLRRITCKGCTPDPSDYGGAPVLPAQTHAAGPAVPATSPAGRAALALLALASIASVTVVRRRSGVV